MNFFIDEQKKVLIAAVQYFNVVDFLCERNLFPELAYNTDQHLKLPFFIFINELTSILCLFLLFIRLVQKKTPHVCQQKLYVDHNRNLTHRTKRFCFLSLERAACDQPDKSGSLDLTCCSLTRPLCRPGLRNVLRLCWSPMLSFEILAEKIGFYGRDDLFFGLHQFLVGKQDSGLFFGLHRFLVEKRDSEAAKTFFWSSPTSGGFTIKKL